VGKLKAIIDSGIRSGIDKPQPPRQMPDEAARQAIRPTEKTIDDFSNEDSFYRIVDEDAYIDLVNSGAVRTNFGNKPGSTITDKLASRPTRYPSFSKGSANKTYAEGKPNHYIIETKDPSIKPSTEGRHGKGTTQFPTDSTGVHLESLPGEAVQVYRHIGDGQYRLVYDQGKVTPNATNAETNVAAPLGNISIPIAAAIAAGTMTPQDAEAGMLDLGLRVLRGDSLDQIPAADPVESLVLGLSRQQSMENQGRDFVPTPDEMLESMSTILKPASTDPDVVSYKGLPTGGAYMGTPETALDVDIVSREDFIPVETLDLAAVQAAEDAQESWFVARRIENRTGASRPEMFTVGAEIYFDGPKPANDKLIQKISDYLLENDVPAYTMIVDPSDANSVIGLRVLDIPQLSGNSKKYATMSKDEYKDTVERSYEQFGKLGRNLEEKFGQIKSASPAYFDVNIKSLADTQDYLGQYGKAARDPDALRQEFYGFKPAQERFRQWEGLSVPYYRDSKGTDPTGGNPTGGNPTGGKESEGLEGLGFNYSFPKALGAGITGLGAMVALPPEEAQAGSIMTGVNLAKEVALKNLATRVNKGELSASEARALSSFVNNSVSPDTLIQGGYLNPNNMDPGQIKAATTRYIKALEDNPMLRRREGIGGARDPSSTEFYPAEMNDPRIILPEDLLGEILMPNVGDTTQIGVLTKFGGYDLPEGVPSHGGPGFPQQMEELGRPYGWASNQGAANAKVAGFNKVATDTNQQPIAVVTSMGEEAQLFASPYAHAWILKAQELNMPKKQAAKFDAEVRRGVPNKDPKKKAIISPFPEWVGINHPDAKAQLLGGPSPTREGVTYPSVGGRRKSVLLTANKNVEWRNSGLPSLGDLHKGLQINPNETAFEVGRSGYSMYTPEIGVPTEPIDFHQAYDTAIRGKYKGQIEGVTVPGRVMFPDIVKAYTDRGKTEAMAIGGFMANPNIYQKADQRWLDGIRDYLDNLPPVDRDNIIKALPALGVTSAGLAALGIALAPSDAIASDIQANQGLVPFDKDIHTSRDVGLGGLSSEYTMTVDAPDGQVAVIPSIWWDTNGEPVVLDQRDAERRSFEYEQETGKQFPRFPAGGYELADEYAQARTRQGGASESPLASEYPSLGGMGVTSRATPDEVAFKAPREPRRIPPKQPPGIASLAGQLGLGAMSEIGGAILGGLGGVGEYVRGGGLLGVPSGAPATGESIRNIREGVSGYVGDLYDAGPEAQALGQQIMQGIGETIAPIAEYAMEGDITDEYGINMLPLLAQKLGIPAYELLERLYSMMPEREQEALKSGADAVL
jgi:hypothetical protein